MLRDYLNLAIYLLNPREKWPAHVTIAGPFRRTAEIPRSLRFVEQISILGRGRFQNGARATIFLRVGSRDIVSRMKKPDYPDSVPHLSLYSGPDTELADLLYTELESAKLYGVFYATHFDVVEARQQFKFDFRFEVRADVLPETAGKSLDQLALLDKQTRVKLAVQAIDRGFTASLAAAASMKIHALRTYRSLAAFGRVPRAK